MICNNIYCSTVQQLIFDGVLCTFDSWICLSWGEKILSNCRPPHNSEEVGVCQFEKAEVAAAGRPIKILNRPFSVAAIGGRICFVIATSICADTSLAISPLTSLWSIETDINVWGSDIIVKFLASTWSDSLLFLQKHRSLLNYEEKQLSRLGSGSLLANMRFVLCEEVRLDCPFYPESTK